MKEEIENERMGGSIFECHGLMGKENWRNPFCVAKSNKPNRKDQGNMTNSSEYLDEPEVLDEKMEIIAKLILNSKYPIVYAGKEKKKEKKKNKN